jgi:hypothetical protein
MFDKRRTHLIIAICTSYVLIAFAVYQRHHAVVMPRSAFYGAAAIIFVIAELFDLFRYKTCRSKSAAR